MGEEGGGGGGGVLAIDGDVGGGEGGVEGGVEGGAGASQHTPTPEGRVQRVGKVLGSGAPPPPHLPWSTSGHPCSATHLPLPPARRLHPPPPPPPDPEATWENSHTLSMTVSL